MRRSGESKPEFKFSTERHTLAMVNIRRFAYVLLMGATLLSACGTDIGSDSSASTTATPTSTTSPTTTTMADDDGDHGGDGGHTHTEMTRDVEAATAPTVSGLEVTESEGGWLVTFDVTGHEFSEVAKGGTHVDGQGHAHLYLNGTKLATIFDTRYVIDDLPDGEHMIAVTLNSNDHATLTLNGEPIGAMAVVTVEADIAPTATVTVTDGESVGGIVRIEVTQGDTVILEITSDSSDDVHVHGLDIYGDAVAGETLLMTFEASLTGIWEIELEGTHTQIAELVVNP